jgi:hypothetical protein
MNKWNHNKFIMIMFSFRSFAQNKSNMALQYS